MPGKSPRTPAKRPSAVDVAVGRNVRIWRMAKGLSQAQLASRLGITFQQLQKYEVGANRIGTGRLVKIAGFLGIPVAALFDGTEAAEPARSLLALVADGRAFRLADAFAAIENATLRLSIVHLVEKIAAAVPQPPRRRRAN
ncbi:MAG TPA: helix-turn-helix transcriptional regulator [Xanthobacteraceae bacterium]|nr:helix-turn-helix transcriptional regulator [Xanthobacteraceae bacterium]